MELDRLSSICQSSLTVSVNERTQVLRPQTKADT